METCTRDTTKKSPLPVPPSIVIASENPSSETRVVTTQHGSRPSTGRTSNNSAQVFSHHVQPCTFEQYPVSQYDTSWHYSSPTNHNSIMSVHDSSTLGCHGNDFDACRSRNKLNSFCIRKPTSSSVDLWRFQAGMQNGHNLWTGPVGCRPY